MKGSVSWVHSKNPQTTCFTDQSTEAPQGGIIRSRSTGLASRTRVQARVWLSPRWGSQCPLRPGELTRYAFVETRLGPGVFCHTNTPPEGRKKRCPPEGTAWAKEGRWDVASGRLPPRRCSQGPRERRALAQGRAAIGRQGGLNGTRSWVLPWALASGRPQTL